MESYSDIVLDHARNPRNLGVLENANARAVQSNSVCGDVLMLTLRIEDERIKDAKFQTEGCTASLAASSMLSEMILDLSLDAALDLSHEDIDAAFGGLPASKLHSAALVIGALKGALTRFKESSS